MHNLPGDKDGEGPLLAAVPIRGLGPLCALSLGLASAGAAGGDAASEEAFLLNLFSDIRLPQVLFIYRYLRQIELLKGEKRAIRCIPTPYGVC